MVVFGENYAQSYDEIYKTKNYLAECDYVLDLANNFQLHSIKNILDLGCGTGTHAIEFARRGYEVEGVDLSVHMLQLAQSKSDEQGLKIKFQQADVSNYLSQNKFDLIVSLFAVVGYLVETDSLIRMFKNVYSQLEDGGVFIFDCWNGNAVLYEKPITKLAHFTRNGREINRISQTTLDIQRNLATVSFTLIDTAAPEAGDRLVIENHQMRYFFIPELSYLLRSVGFKEVIFYKFMTTELPGYSDWNLTVLAKK